MFDFATILERTERRVRDDLLGAGPKSVGELRSIAGRLRLKYETQLEKRIQRATQQQNQLEGIKQDTPAANPPPLKDVLDKAGGAAGAVAGAAGALAGGLFAKMKNTGAALGSFNPVVRPNTQPETSVTVSRPTIVDLPPPPTPNTDVMVPQIETEGDWAGTDIASATDAISNFSIGDEEEDDML